MNHQMTIQIARYRIEEQQANAQVRRLAREARGPRRRRFPLPFRRPITPILEPGTAEWWRATAAAPSRGLPA